MNPTPSYGYFYQVGGSLPTDAPTYVRRSSDEDFYSCLKNGEFCYVLNSRQMGKSSLRVQTMKRLEDDGFACATIDITAIGTADITPEQWYAGIIDYLVESFNLYIDFELKTWWQENSLLSPVQHLGKFIETILLKRVEQNIIIFIDEIDSILSLPFNLDDFFALIRDCYNNRAFQGAYNRLTFALLGVSTPSDLIQDRRRTPFNIGRAIDLTGFELTEAEPLTKGLAALGNPQQLMQAVFNWTGGQPFLTQKVCRLLRNEAGKCGENPSILVEELVRGRIIENWEAQDEPDHLKTIRDRILLSFEKGKGRLLGLYQQILVSNGQGIGASDSPEQTQLRLTGLVVRRDGRLKIYNRIYESVFNLAWVEQELAKLRPYADAIDAWITSNYEDKSRLLRGQALQDALLWANNKSLSDEDNRFLRASQELDKREVTIALDAERQAKEILSAAQAKAELALEEEKQANQRLKEAQRKTQLQVSVGTGVLAVSIVGAVIALIVAGEARQQLYALTVTRLERDGVNVLQKFQGGGEIASLQLAIQAGQELKTLVKNKPSLADYPAYSPVLNLQQILLNIRERNQLQQFGVNSVTFSPDSKILASASDDKTIKLWDVETGKQVAFFTGHQDRVNSVAFSPDGKTLASASDDKTIKLWNVGSIKQNFRLSGNQRKVSSATPNLGEKTPVSAIRGKTTKAWNIPTGKQIASLRKHQGAVSSVAFSPDSKTLASASNDNTIKLWDVTTGKPIVSLSGHEDRVNSIAFSPNGKTLASGSQDNTIKLWDITTGRKIASLNGHQFRVLSVAFSPDGKTLASASWDSTIKLWNIATGRQIASLAGHQSFVFSVAFSPDGKTLASASQDKTIKLWNVATGKQIASLTGHQNVVICVTFSPDGKTLASASQDKTIKLWSVANNKQIPLLTGHKDKVNSVAFSPDSQTLASASNDNTIKLWNVATSKQTAFLVGHQDKVNSVAFSPDSTTLASGGSDKTIKLWNVVTGKQIASFNGHLLGVSEVIFSPDGKTLVSGSSDKTIKLWNVATGKQITSLNGHLFGVSGVAFSPNGKMLASASWNNIKLWNVVNGKEIASLTRHQDLVRSITFSPDSKTLASGSQDKTIKLWNVSTSKEITTLTGHQNSINSIAFSLDGKTLASGSSDKTIKLWNVVTSKEIATLTGHQNSVNSVTFSPDSITLASGSSDKNIKLWSLDLNNLLSWGCSYLKNYFVTYPDKKKDLCP